MSRVVNKAKKAEKLVQGAVGVFENAIAQIEKAQEILKSGIQDDTRKIAVIENYIEEQKKERDKYLNAKADKYTQMQSNEELIEKLKNFSLQ